MLGISRVGRTTGPQPMGQLVQLVPRGQMGKGFTGRAAAGGQRRGCTGWGAAVALFHWPSCVSRVSFLFSDTGAGTEAKGKCSLLCRPLCGNVAQGWTAKLGLGTGRGRVFWSLRGPLCP